MKPSKTFRSRSTTWFIARRVSPTFERVSSPPDCPLSFLQLPGLSPITIRLNIQWSYVLLWATKPHLISPDYCSLVVRSLPRFSAVTQISCEIQAESGNKFISMNPLLGTQTMPNLFSLKIDSVSLVSLSVTAKRIGPTRTTSCVIT